MLILLKIAWQHSFAGLDVNQSVFFFFNYLLSVIVKRLSF